MDRSLSSSDGSSRRSVDIHVEKSTGSWKKLREKPFDDRACVLSRLPCGRSGAGEAQFDDVSVMGACGGIRTVVEGAAAHRRAR